MSQERTLSGLAAHCRDVGRWNLGHGHMPHHGLRPRAATTRASRGTNLHQAAPPWDPAKPDTQPIAEGGCPKCHPGHRRNDAATLAAYWAPRPPPVGHEKHFPRRTCSATPGPPGSAPPGRPGSRRSSPSEWSRGSSHALVPPVLVAPPAQPYQGRPRNDSFALKRRPHQRAKSEGATGQDCVSLECPYCAEFARRGTRSGIRSHLLSPPQPDQTPTGRGEVHAGVAFPSRIVRVPFMFAL